MGRYANKTMIMTIGFFSLIPLGSLFVGLMFGDDRMEASTISITMLRLSVLPYALGVHITLIQWLKLQMAMHFHSPEFVDENGAEERNVQVLSSCLFGMGLAIIFIKLIQRMVLSVECAYIYDHPWVCY